MASPGLYASLHLAPQITTPAPHHSVFYRPDALPATQPTASKHWRHIIAGNFDRATNPHTADFAHEMCFRRLRQNPTIYPWQCSQWIVTTQTVKSPMYIKHSSCVPGMQAGQSEGSQPLAPVGSHLGHRTVDNSSYDDSWHSHRTFHLPHVQLTHSWLIL